MSNCVFGYPVYSDVNTIFAPSFSGGSWLATGDIALANLQDRRMSKVARSTDAKLTSTRFAFDLKAARRVGVIAIPSHTLSRAAKLRFLAQTGALIFDYEAGDDLTALGVTFSRGLPATYHDSAGIPRLAGSNEPRDGHFINGNRTFLTEQARKNLCLQSENFGTTWTAGGTPTRVAANLTFGSLVLDLLGDTSGSLLSFYSQNFAFTGDGTKAISAYFAQGSATTSAFALKDTTASTYRLWGTITWTGSVPTITMAFGTLVQLQAWGTLNGVTLYRALFSTTAGLLAANTNQFQVLPASDVSGTVGLTGTINVGGVQAEDAVIPSSYIPNTTTATTRPADSVQLPLGFLPPSTGLTMYERHVELGTQTGSTGGSYVTIGSWAGAGGFSLTSYSANPTTFDSAEQNGTTQLNGSGVALTASYGDDIETRTTVTAAGAVQGAASKNSGAEVTAAASATQAIPAGWGAGQAILRINDRGAVAGVAAFRSIRIMAGVQTQTVMRAAVYDTGWLDVWPVVYPAGSLPADDPRMVDGKFSAEEAVNFNIGFVHVPPAAITFRYGSIQIADDTNAATYVDLGRLMVCGSYQPSLNMIYGAKLGLTTESTRIVTDGGAASYNEKPTARYQAFSIESIPEDELLVNLFDLMRRVGITKQFFYVHDPADTYHLHRRSFPCVMRELSALEYPSYKRGTQPIAVIEDL